MTASRIWELQQQKQQARGGAHTALSLPCLLASQAAPLHCHACLPASQRAPAPAQLPTPRSAAPTHPPRAGGPPLLQAVAHEDYDEAKRLKGAVERLRCAGARIAALEARKAAAVAGEDYDLAKQLKAEVDRAR